MGNALIQRLRRIRIWGWNMIMPVISTMVVVVIVVVMILLPAAHRNCWS
jgi:uncharacterized membrane protein